jgi:hypothetical protein
MDEDENRRGRSRGQVVLGECVLDVVLFRNEVSAWFKAKGQGTCSLSVFRCWGSRYVDLLVVAEIIYNPKFNLKSQVVK